MEFKGFTYGFDGQHGEYRSPAGIKSQKLLFETGVNWICLAFYMLQDTAVSTSIGYDYGNSVTDRDIMAAVKHAHDNNIKVCLKPMVNCKDGTWRARINFPDLGEFDGSDDDIYWNKWFEAYEAFLTYYAELAEETNCEMLCIGCEMLGTERKETLWRKLIAKIRGIYSGKLIYNTNHSHEKDVNWFDAVDYVGTSAYFSVGKADMTEDILNTGDLTRETMLSNWEKIANELEEVHNKWKKPIVFIEIGCRSAKTCSTMPWDYEHKDLPRDEEEQALFYDTCLSVMTNKPWFGGVFWWDWSTFIYDTEEEAKKNDWFNIHLKKAETVIKDWYSKL